MLNTPHKLAMRLYPDASAGEQWALHRYPLDVKIENHRPLVLVPLFSQSRMLGLRLSSI